MVKNFGAKKKMEYGLLVMLIKVSLIERQDIQYINVIKMEHWQQAAEEAKKRKELLSKFPLLGKRVRRKGRKNWEYGEIVLDKFEDETEEYEFIKYDDGTSEQLMLLPFEVWDETKEMWIKGVD